MMCLPLYSRADKIRKEEEEKLSKLKPYIDKIKKNFKGDERFFLLQTLYRQNNYNPIMALRNSFSLLLQIPFFIAAYHFFSNLEILNGYSWAMISDLSKPDMLLSLSGLKINLLPVLMTVLNIISCEVYLKTKSFEARIQPYLFALVFLILLYNSPSGLVLYWTFNNFFYLLKNKFMDDKNPSKFVYKLLGFMILAYFINKLSDLTYVMSVILQFFIILYPYIILLFVLKYIKDNYGDLNEIPFNSVIKLFLLCGLGFILLQGIIIPFGILTSDLSMFSIELSSTKNITNYALEILLSIIGLYLFWGTIVFYFTPPQKKTYFIMFFLACFLFSLFNYLNFGNNLGTIDTNLRFESINIEEILSGDTKSQLINISVLGFILCLVIYIFKKSYIKWLINFTIVIVLSEIIVSGIYVSKLTEGIAYIDSYTKNNKDVWEQSNHIELSKSNKNVIIIFLDRFLGALLPKILEEKPELKKVYSGFTFYPNTVSHAVNTVLGYPPCVGGYEYIPFILDKDKRDFSEKWLEASLMLPTLFKKEGYLSTVVDPIGDADPNTRFYKNDNFKNIYSSKGLNYVKMQGMHNSLFRHDILKDSKIREQIQKRLFSFTFLSIAPNNCKSLIYSNGFYLLFRRLDELNNHVYYSEKAVLGAYSSLAYLQKITKFNSCNNTFTIIHNDLPHCLFLFQYPNYEYTNKLTNIGKSSFKDNFSIMAYNTTMASALLVGKYLEYLKQTGVYDNSRIIIMSDHGNKYVHFPEYSKFENEVILVFNPLLMVKEFNQNWEMKTDDTFMTNADVPYIATRDLIDNPKNPFTGKQITNEIKQNGVNVYLNHSYWNINHFTSSKVIFGNPPNVKHVKDNIFDESNWKDIKYDNN